MPGLDSIFVVFPFIFINQLESKPELRDVLQRMNAYMNLQSQIVVALVVAACGAGALPALAQPAAAREWTSPPPGDVQRGAVLYQQHCTACHSIDSNKIGPAHGGVMGRRVGSLPGYKYSNELAASRLRWTPQTLNAWLTDPEELVSGQRMGFLIENAQERGDLIAYLASLK